MKKHLLKLYPLAMVAHGKDEHSAGDGDVTSGSSSAAAGTVFSQICFPQLEENLREMMPFCLTIVALFLYVYFSCSKIKVFRSKVGIAASAAVTVLMTICMALGMSGVGLSVSSPVYFVPYLVAFISLENVLVVTRSVVGTPEHLDVKVRVAQGLGKEGWNMTKNLFCQITILTMGYAVGALTSYSEGHHHQSQLGGGPAERSPGFGVHAQEFCLLAVMGLLSDFFMQTFFFVTVLSMDMYSFELCDEVRTRTTPNSGSGKLSSGVFDKTSGTISGGEPKNAVFSIFRSDSSGTCNVMIYPWDNDDVDRRVRQRQALLTSEDQGRVGEARRVKLLYFWAQRRIVQRVFVLVMLGWLSTVVLNQFSLVDVSRAAGAALHGLPTSALLTSLRRETTNSTFSEAEKVDDDRQKSGGGNGGPLFDEPWRRLPARHWPMLFGIYNLSLHGRCLTMLPPIRLSMVVSPEMAKSLRHPDEAAILESESRGDVDHLGKNVSEDEEDVDDEAEAEETRGLLHPDMPELSPFTPTSRHELLLAFVLAAPTFLFLTYLCVLLYRCICPKDYAEWRSSWYKATAGADDASAAPDPSGRAPHPSDRYTQVWRDLLTCSKQAVAEVVSERRLVGCDTFPTCRY